MMTVNELEFIILGISTYNIGISSYSLGISTYQKLDDDSKWAWIHNFGISTYNQLRMLEYQYTVEIST